MNRIKRIQFILLFAIVCFSLDIPTFDFATQMSAATVSSTATPAKKSTKSKKTSASNKAKRTNKAKAKNNHAAKTPATKQKTGKRKFEGHLLYRNMIYMNNVIKNLSFGQGYLGDQTLQVTIKDDNVHIHDQTLHQHIIITAENNVFLYSDISKTGLQADTAFIKKYYGTLDRNSTFFKENGAIYNVTPKDEFKTYKGDKCKVLAGNISACEGQSETDVEMWYSDTYIVPKNYSYTFMSLPLPGIVRKGIVSSRVSVPLFGAGKSTMAYELMAVTETSVPDSEFIVPDDISLKKFTKNSDLIKYYKESKKALKKNNLYPKSQKKKHVEYAINEEWDFANEWLHKDPSKSNDAITWAKIGTALLDGAQTITQIWHGDKANTSSTSTGSGSVATNGESNSQNPQNMDFGEKMVSCDSIIRELEGYKRRMIDLVGKKDAKDAVNEFDTQLQWLRNQLRYGNKYIPQSVWKSYADERRQISNQKHQKRMQNMKMNNDRTKQQVKNMSKSNYYQFESALQNYHDYPSKYDYDHDIDDVRKWQRQMREIRAKYNLPKSKWEDWDGIPGSMH